MKKLLPLLLLILIGCSEVKNPRNDGPYETYYRNGQLKEKGIIKESWWNGPYISYYENGMIKEEGTRRDTLKIYYDSDGKSNSGIRWRGPFKFYYENGQLEREGNLEKGDEKVGVWKEYYPFSGVLKREVDFEDVYIRINPYMKYTLEKEYYENGQLKKVNGSKVQGIRKDYKYYDESGELLEGYLEGVVVKLYKSYHPNGKLREKGYRGYYISDIKYGSYKSYYNDGQIQLEENYSFTQKDKLDGIWKLYDVIGRIEIEGLYINGKKDGVWKYSKFGELKREETYKDGELIDSKTYNMN